jgi:hypothetical protein
VKKIFNILSHQRNANQNYPDISFYPRMVIIKKTTHAGKDAGKKKPFLYSTGGNSAAIMEIIIEPP